MKKYTPNFKDPRVIARTNLALNFVTRVFKRKTAIIMLSRDNLDKPDHFGQSNNQLSRYLREILLICSDPYYNQITGVSKKYRLNQIGVRYLTEVLEGTTTDDWATYRDYNKHNTTLLYNSALLLQQADELFEKHQDEIESGNFLMKKIGTREYHRLQTIPRDIRAVKFAQQGYIHDYDIETAAPSLLLQRARRCGLVKDTPVIDYFLENKTIIRNIIAADCGISYQQAKQVITALFQGGILSCWPANKIFNDTLNYNTLAMKELQAHSLVRALRDEIRDMWKVLSKNIKRETYLKKDGKTANKRISGKQKSDIYFEIEEEVMKEVKRYLKKDKQMRVITEHDGWRTDKMINLDELKTKIRQRTGYVINIAYEHILINNITHTTL